MHRAESEFQRAELDGRKNRSNDSNYQYEAVGNDNGNTAVTIERLNGFNERVSGAKQRADRERKDVDKRLRTIGVSSQLFERTKHTIIRSIRPVDKIVGKIKKNATLKRRV